MPENEQLTALRRMRSEGRISDEEYNHLARGITMSTSPIGVADEEGQTGEITPLEDERAATGTAIQTPSMRKGLSPSFITGVGMLGLLLLVTSVLGVVPWLATFAALLLLSSTMLERGRTIALIAGVVLGAVAVIGLVSSLADGPSPSLPVAATLPPEDPHPPVPGSLDIYMDQITDAWNSVDGPPSIVKGLTRHNETGEYDTFIYRWGEWGRLAGAYDPENDMLYALLVSGRLSADDTDQLYVPLCFMVAPYSQACVDSYHEKGLGGEALEAFVDVEHEAEWELEDQTWRLQITQNVMTIRVFGEDAA